MRINVGAWLNRIISVATSTRDVGLFFAGLGWGLLHAFWVFLLSKADQQSNILAALAIAVLVSIASFAAYSGRPLDVMVSPAVPGAWVATTEASWLVVTVQDQLNAILSAPIPFIVVCFFALASGWGMMRWLYKERMEKTKHLFELSRNEIEITSRVAKLKLDEANATIESVKKELDETKDRTPEIISVSEKVSELKVTVGEAAKANNAISNAVSRSPGSANMGLSTARSGFGVGTFS